MSDRLTVAEELATKDGHAWEQLSEVMLNAYLHNAELVIEERNRSTPDPISGKPIYACEQCHDHAYIRGMPCRECNPVGLPVEQVHPGKLTLDNIDEAIDTLKKEGKDPRYTTEDDDLTEEEMKAAAQAKKEAEEAAEAVRATRELRPNEYRCSKCSKPGKTVIHMVKKDGTGIGTKHLGFKDRGRDE